MYVKLKCPICGKESIKRHDAKTCGKPGCRSKYWREDKKKKENEQ